MDKPKIQIFKTQVGPLIIRVAVTDDGIELYQDYGDPFRYSNPEFIRSKDASYNPLTIEDDVKRIPPSIRKKDSHEPQLILRFPEKMGSRYVGDLIEALRKALSFVVKNPQEVLADRRALDRFLNSDGNKPKLMSIFGRLVPIEGTLTGETRESRRRTKISESMIGKKHKSNQVPKVAWKWARLRWELLRGDSEALQTLESAYYVEALKRGWPPMIGERLKRMASFKTYRIDF